MLCEVLGDALDGVSVEPEPAAAMDEEHLGSVGGDGCLRQMQVADAGGRFVAVGVGFGHGVRGLDGGGGEAAAACAVVCVQAAFRQAVRWLFPDDSVALEDDVL